MLKYSLLFITLLAVSFMQAQQFVIQSHEKKAKDSYILIGLIQNSEGKPEMQFSIKTQKGDFIAPDSTGKFVFSMKKQTKLLAIKDNLSQEVRYVLIYKSKVYPLDSIPVYIEGIAKIRKENGNWIYIDESTQEVINQSEYEEATDFNKGISITKSHNQKYTIVSKEGAEIRLNNLPPMDGSIDAPIPLDPDRNGKLEYRTTDNHSLNDEEYDEANYFQEGIALVRQGKKYFFIDKEGNKMMKIGEFDSMKKTDKGYEGQREGKRICLDKKGAIVANCSY